MKTLFFPKVLLGLVLIVFLFEACAPSRIVRPLEKGERQVSAHLGGPLIGFAGTTIPMPMTSVMYAQGASDKTTVFAGLHTTAMLFGVFQTDIGACYRVYQADSSRFGLSVSPVINMAYDKWEGNFKLWPEIDVNAYWEFTPKKSFMYVGASNWFELSGKKAHDEVQENRWLINPHLGYTYVMNKWNYNIETKYLVPNIDKEPNAVDYKSFSSKGAIGIYITFTRKF